VLIGLGIVILIEAGTFIRHSLRHTAITWYLDQGVVIEKVGLYCGVSVATIRKTYWHLMPGAFDTLLHASQQFGR
jgi:hypothetical protein